jgi:hypothetical protein
VAINTGTPFKRKRRPREVATDLAFAGGMFYTNKPLASGYNRRLINYDLVDGGASIRSRGGLKFQNKVLLESVPVGGDLVLQTGHAQALFTYVPTVQWKANSIVGLGDTLEPSLLVTVSSSGIARLAPGHLYLIGNPAVDGPPDYLYKGDPDNTTPCFKLGDLFHTSPFYDNVLLQEEIRETTPKGKNYFYLNAYLQADENFLSIPSDAAPPWTMVANKETQELFINGAGDGSFRSIHLGNWVNRPNVPGILRVTLTGTMFNAFGHYPRVTWGQYGSYHTDNLYNADIEIPQLPTEPGWDHGEVFLSVPVECSLTNVTIKVQLESGTSSTEWEAYQPGDIVTPAEYAKLNNIPFSNNYWMQQSPCCFGFDGKFAYFISKIIQDPGFMDPMPLIKNYLMLSNGGRGTDTVDRWNFDEDLVIPKVLNPSEAAMWGYNMLSDTPYTFGNGTTGSVMTLTGLLPYTANGQQIELNPKVNQTIMLECFYSAATPSDYKIKFEWKDIVSATWTEIAEVSADANGRFMCTFTNPGKEIFIRATSTKTATPSEQTVIAAGFNFSPTTQPSKFENYNLTAAKYIMYHNHRLAFYGIDGAEDLLFLSDYDDPSYVPYPNNMLQFDSAIKKVVEYQQSWLVFTLTSVYLVRLQADGLTWTQELIQGGLEITDINALFICAIKSFVIFKSGNYIYLIVPSSSIAGSLTIAPIYLPIKEVLDNLDQFFQETLRDVCSYSDSYELVQFQPYTTLDDIHLVFSLKLQTGQWFNIDFIYNTLTRGWKIYTYETPGMFLPYIKDVTQGPQILTADPENADQIKSYQFGQSSEDINDDTALVYNNNQVLDTGYREIFSDIKKRFREIQYIIYVEDPTVLKFALSFYIDGIVRKAPEILQGELREDPDEPGRYLLFITDAPVYDALPNVLAPDNPDLPAEYWTLDTTDFGRKFNIKVRNAVSGKGFAGRIVLKANNTAAHELLSNAWVFRLMNSR